MLTRADEPRTSFSDDIGKAFDDIGLAASKPLPLSTPNTPQKPRPIASSTPSATTNGGPHSEASALGKSADPPSQTTNGLAPPPANRAPSVRSVSNTVKDVTTATLDDGTPVFFIDDGAPLPDESKLFGTPSKSHANKAFHQKDGRHEDDRGVESHDSSAQQHEQLASGPSERAPSGMSGFPTQHGSGRPTGGRKSSFADQADVFGAYGAVGAVAAGGAGVATASALSGRDTSDRGNEQEHIMDNADSRTGMRNTQTFGSGEQSSGTETGTFAAGARNDGASSQDAQDLGASKDADPPSSRGPAEHGEPVDSVGGAERSSQLGNNAIIPGAAAAGAGVLATSAVMANQSTATDTSDTAGLTPGTTEQPASRDISESTPTSVAVDEPFSSGQSESAPTTVAAEEPLARGPPDSVPGSGHVPHVDHVDDVPGVNQAGAAPSTDLPDPEGSDPAPFVSETTHEEGTASPVLGPSGHPLELAPTTEGSRRASMASAPPSPTSPRFGMVDLAPAGVAGAAGVAGGAAAGMLATPPRMPADRSMSAASVTAIKDGQEGKRGGSVGFLASPMGMPTDRSMSAASVTAIKDGREGKMNVRTSNLVCEAAPKTGDTFGTSRSASPSDSSLAVNDTLRGHDPAASTASIVAIRGGNEGMPPSPPGRSPLSRMSQEPEPEVMADAKEEQEAPVAEHESTAEPSSHTMAGAAGLAGAGLAAAAGGAALASRDGRPRNEPEQPVEGGNDPASEPSHAEDTTRPSESRLVDNSTEGASLPTESQQVGSAVHGGDLPSDQQPVGASIEPHTAGDAGTSLPSDSDRAVPPTVIATDTSATSNDVEHQNATDATATTATQTEPVDAPDATEREGATEIPGADDQYLTASTTTPARESYMSLPQTGDNSYAPTTTGGSTTPRAPGDFDAAVMAGSQAAEPRAAASVQDSNDVPGAGVGAADAAEGVSPAGEAAGEAPLDARDEAAGEAAGVTGATGATGSTPSATADTETPAVSTTPAEAERDATTAAGEPTSTDGAASAAGAGAATSTAGAAATKAPANGSSAAETTTGSRFANDKPATSSTGPIRTVASKHTRSDSKSSAGSGRRKLGFMSKLKGEIKVISDKLKNDDKKVAN